MTLPVMSDPAIGAVLAELPTEHNWNSYGAVPTTDDAKATVATMLRYLSVVPTSSGGVQIEVHTRALDLEIEVDATGRPKSICWECG